jgi:6-pyruvoyltetrahydropterin/6-carboxytetrahydropterin synthase
MKATKKYRSSKLIELGSAAFRQWRSTHSHCQYIHGYNLMCRMTFESETLDERNWVADFGGFKKIKEELQEMFDHKLVVAADDPLLYTLKLLEREGGCQITVLDSVGCEKFAEYAFSVVKKHTQSIPNVKYKLINVEIYEHEKNSASYSEEY